MKSINIFIADRSATVRNAIHEACSTQKNMHIVGQSENGKECLDKLRELGHVDVLIIDLILPIYDGYYVLHEIRKSAMPVDYIICTSSLVNELILQFLSEQNVDLFMHKPYEMTSLLISLKQLNRRVFTKNKPYIELKKIKGLNSYSISLEERIINILHEIGIPGHVKGYVYLKKALEMSYNNPDILGKITKLIYPEVALQNRATSSGVERAIRHAITIAWNHWKLNNISHIVGFDIEYFRKRPTNAEFLAFIINKFRLDDKKHLIKQIDLFKNHNGPLGN